MEKGKRASEYLRNGLATLSLFHCQNQNFLIAARNGCVSATYTLSVSAAISIIGEVLIAVCHTARFTTEEASVFRL